MTFRDRNSVDFSEYDSDEYTGVLDKNGQLVLEKVDNILYPLTTDIEGRKALLADYYANYSIACVEADRAAEEHRDISDVFTNSVKNMMNDVKQLTGYEFKVSDISNAIFGNYRNKILSGMLTIRNKSDAVTQESYFEYGISLIAQGLAG